MAQKVKIDLSQFKASGVYTLEFDSSQSVVLTSQTIRLVVGFSNVGPFNTAVFLPDAKTAVAIFGEIDRSLENKGSFFQRSILTCLQQGPVFALNLLRLNNDLDSSNPDIVPYRSYSVDTEEANGVLTERLYSSYYNKERLWYADPEYFLATRSVVDQSYLLNFVNLGQKPMSIILRKSTDSTAPLLGYNIFAIDWYGANNVPSFMNPYDYIEDYFIDAIAISGDWTDYTALSLDPKWSSYFTPNGFIKSRMDSFLNNQDVNIVTTVTGCIIPDFVDLNGVNQYIQTLVNNNTASTGLFCAVNEQAMDDICNNASRIDLVGNHLIDELTGDRDLSSPNLNFLSYYQPLLADLLYTQNVYGVTGFGGSTGATGTGLESGTLFIANGTTGGSAGMTAAYFNPFSFDLTDGGLHYLQTNATGPTGARLALQNFLTVTAAEDAYIVGQVTGISGLSGPTINLFNEFDYVKLEVKAVTEVSGQLRISYTHPLDNASYYAQGIRITPSSKLAGYQAEPGDASTQPTLFNNAYQFGVWDTVTRDVVSSPNGATGPAIPGGTAYTLVGGSNSQLYYDVVYKNLQDGDTYWLNSSGSQIRYIASSTTVDKDQFGISYTRAYSNVSLGETTQTDVAAFGATYSSANVGTPVSAGKFDIISDVGSINSFVNVITKVDSVTFTCSSVPDSPISVGDLLVSTDLDICTVGNTNRQNRLTKVLTVSQTTTEGVIRVTTARPILYYSYSENGSSGIRVQKFKSIPQFTRSFDFTYLRGFTMTDYHRPNGTDARISEILDVMYTTSIAATLASKDVIAYRYIIDTFSGQILPNSKYQLSLLAQRRQQALALINAPSMAQFRASTDPRFTDAPTATDPYPALQARYIADGGNLALNPTYTFSLPSEAQGAKFAAFYTPYITIRENNRNLNVPPAAYVSNNFVLKFSAGQPYAIVAGQKRGVISGANVVGVEYDFTDDDRGYLEPFGLNPIIKRRGLGVVIFGNNTAYQQVSSAFGLVHVRDLLISVETDTIQILSNYLFDFNEDSVRLEIKTLVDNYLDGVRSAGGIYAYQAIMDASNNTPAVIDMNMGIIDIIIEPARGIQKFVNRITVTKTGGIASGGFTTFG
jgi:hypothetical protein